MLRGNASRGARARRVVLRCNMRYCVVTRRAVPCFYVQRVVELITQKSKELTKQKSKTREEEGVNAGACASACASARVRLRVRASWWVRLCVCVPSWIPPSLSVACFHFHADIVRVTSGQC